MFELESPSPLTTRHMARLSARRFQKLGYRVILSTARSALTVLIWYQSITAGLH